MKNTAETKTEQTEQANEQETMIFWQVTPASGIKRFASPALAAEWVDGLLSSCPDATVERI